MANWAVMERDGGSIPTKAQGKGQGSFRYYRTGYRKEYSVISAVGGRLYLNGGYLAIEGLPGGFQNTRIVEAVQWKDRLFIATGTKLVEYDGRVAKVVEPYKPKPLEALYVGTNGMMTYPDNYMQDGEAGVLTINGVVPSLRKGYVDTPITFNTFVSKPNDDKEVEYKMEYKLSNRDTFIKLKDWSSTKTWKWTPKEVGDYIIQVSARYKGTTDEPNKDDPEVYQIPVYKVTAYNENTAPDVSKINSCNRILLHWERLILYGEEVHNTRIYISHLQNPRYFPTNNTLEFENAEQEPLTILVQYRDVLVAFLKSSIQLLSGTAPIGDNAYTRSVIHTGIGCIAPETAKVTGNDILFMSKEGMYRIKAFGIVNDKMNVQRIDEDVSNQIQRVENACAVVHENQYHLCFPDTLTRFRFYHETGVWVKDESPYFDFCQMKVWNQDLYAQSSKTGRLFLFDNTVYTDIEHVYEARMKTKSFSFGEPYNPKKLKELQLIVGRDQTEGLLASVTVLVDDNYVVNPDSSHAEVLTEQKPKTWEDDSLTETWR